MKIAVYGASGYTGKLVAAEVDRRGFDLVMLGRNETRLRAAANDLRIPKPELRPASLSDPEGLRTALTGCDVVVNCAGPFTALGESVVHAAIAAGCHYVDTAGEQAYVKKVFDLCSEDATEARVSVVPSMGYDILPGDFIAHLTCHDIEPIEHLTIAYAATGFDMTRGTMHSALHSFQGRDLRLEQGEWRQTGLRSHRDSVQFPGQRKASPMIKFPSGEIVTVPRHVDVANMDIAIDACALVPSRSFASLSTRMGPIMALTLRSPLRRLFDVLIDRLPEGPNESKRRKSTFTVMAIARRNDGSEIRGIVSGRDIYGSTAVMCVEGARRLATGSSPAGVLAPAQAFDPTDFLCFLKPYGVDWSVGEKPVWT
ncbi:short subunit dehydrogenase-like uncharacterized protein [Tamaricihabitans halophyticus]|uniref:Short subunit dehydrogenase-like uncharacterized protein n=1 Tax=Tamaricihabitans halophyticus TaxID=1262583 RepID=A0A4R2QDW9_9PSEU|nr:saccharopine dehydrogenase NADP-binding domain-containing protein [Tamaricihabitans halophyticus]TCP47260.1 short subunit dehydrogenase-like uncharacterized protein [Tamaricihabitans halophyticus]